MKIFDAHLHSTKPFPVEKSIENYKQYIKWTNTEKLAFLSLPCYNVYGQNIKNLFYKEVFSPNGYAFAGLEYHPYQSKKELSEQFLAQVKLYSQVGYDGIKMLEGKPFYRKELGYGLADDCYDKAFGYLEEKQIPIILHNADPEENWDYDRLCEWGKTHNWFVGPDQPTKREFYDEVIKVLKKHPRLRLTMAHFGFTSEKIEEAEEFLSYPNTMLDTTPGGEQFMHFLENERAWKEFFVKYQDRIIYGTDTYNYYTDDEEEWYRAMTSRPNLVKDFFASNQESAYLGEPNFKFKGWDFPKAITDKIFFGNAYREFGEPKPIDYLYMLEKLEALKGCFADDSLDEQDRLYMLNYVKNLKK